MAPQAFLQNIYGPKTDVWAFGVLLFEVFHGYTPLQTCGNNQQLERLIRVPFHRDQIQVIIHQDAQQLICLCLTHQQSQRPTFKQLWTHSYIKSLRLKTYIQPKQLSYYKQKTISKSMPSTQQISPREKGQLRGNSAYKVELNQQDYFQAHKSIQGQGYSFEDFLKMSQQTELQGYNEINQGRTADNSQLKINKNSSRKQENDTEDKQFTCFQLQMLQFYKEASLMIQKSQSISPVQTQIDKGKIQKQNIENKTKYNSLEQIKTQNLVDQVPAKVNQGVKTKSQANIKTKQTFQSGKNIQSPQNKIKYQRVSYQQSQFKGLSNTQAQQVKSPKQKINQFQGNVLRKLDVYIWNGQDNSGCKIQKGQQLGWNYSISYIQIKKDKVNQQSNEGTLQINMGVVHPGTEQLQKSLVLKKKQQIQQQNLSNFQSLFSEMRVNYKNKQKQKEEHSEQPSTQRQSLLDETLVILQSVIFIAKYLRFVHKLSEENKQHKKTKINWAGIEEQQQRGSSCCCSAIRGLYPIIFQSPSLRSQIMLQQELLDLCSQLLMKGVSQRIFKLGLQTEKQLIGALRTHKLMLNDLKLQAGDRYLKGRYNQNRNLNKRDVTQDGLECFFQKAYKSIKTIQQPITLFIQSDSPRICQHVILQPARNLCWISLWLSKIYKVFLELSQISLFKMGRSKIRRQTSPRLKHLIKDLRTFNQFKIKQVAREIQMFSELFQNTYCQAEQNPWLDQNKQKKDEEYNIEQSYTSVDVPIAYVDKQATIKQDMNYLYQLIYQIDLKRLNLQED